jgi:carbonic anhydrase
VWTTVRGNFMVFTMNTLKKLFEQNRAWADKMFKQDPDFFSKLVKQQSPEYLWIGCSDSRVPANEIVGLMPGELFVHRNVANVVVHTDLNCLSVIQFAVDMLKIKHIMVVGHYGCSGVSTALKCERVGLADNWLRHVQDVREKHDACICGIKGTSLQIDRLCELNVIEQVSHVCQTSIVRDAWHRNQSLTVHGWVYGISDGKLRNLNCEASSPAEAAESYKSAIAELAAGV